VVGHPGTVVPTVAPQPPPPPAVASAAASVAFPIVSFCRPWPAQIVPNGYAATAHTPGGPSLFDVGAPGGGGGGGGGGMCARV